MGKELDKMKSIRIVRIGLKEVLSNAERNADYHRAIITANWDEDKGDKDARRALYKAHKGLAKARKVINECQIGLKATKLEIRKLNYQYDMRKKAHS